MLTSMHAGTFLRGLRQQRRMTREDLADTTLPASRLLLLEDGVEPTKRERHVLAERLGCSEALLVGGLPARRGKEVRARLAEAADTHAAGYWAAARALYGALTADPELGSRPLLWCQAELGLALAEEAEGDLAAAIERLPYVLDVVAPLNAPLPAMAFEGGFDDDEEADLRSLSAMGFVDAEETDLRIDLGLALCRCLREAGQLDDAIKVGDVAFSRELPGGWTDRVVELGATLLAAYIERGDRLTCAALAGQLLEAADQLGTPRALRAAAWNGATVAARAGDADRAEALSERALAMQARLTDDPRSIGRLRARMADNLLEYCPQAHDQARRMLEAARLELCGSAASTVDLAYCELSLARVHLLAGDPAAAARQAAEIAARHPDARNIVAQATLVHAEALRALNQPSAAADLQLTAGAQLEGMHSPARAAQAYAVGADDLEACGQSEDSTRAFQRALAVSDSA